MNLADHDISWARNYARRVMAELGIPAWADHDALEGAALEGLCQAAARFDPTRNVPFRSFAVIRIRGALRDQIRSTTHSNGYHGRPPKYEVAIADDLPPDINPHSTEDPSAALSYEIIEDRILAHAILRRLIPTLETRDRLITILRLCYGWTLARIAANVGLTEGAVSIIMKRVINAARNSPVLREAA